MHRRAYAIIIACFFTVSIAYSIRYAYGMLLPEMLTGLNLSKTQAGAIYAVYFVIYTVFTPVLGTLSDLFNYRLLLSLFTALLGCGALLMAVATGFAQACLFFSLAGFGHAACWAPVASLVQKWVPDNKRGMALSFVTMGIGLGIPVWGTVLPMIVAAADWRMGWAALGFFGLGVALLNAVLIRNPAPPDTTQVTAMSKFRQIWPIYKALFKQKPFWFIGTAYLLAGFNVLIPFTFLSVYATEDLGLDYAVATRFVGIIAFFGIAGQLTLGTLSDVLGRIRVLILCSLIMGTACLGMIFFRSEWGLYAVAAFYGLGYGAIWPVYAAAASDFFRKDQTGSVVGLWTVYLGLGSIISPVICGWTIDQTGVYTSAFVMGLASGVLAALVLIRLLRSDYLSLNSA